MDAEMLKRPVNVGFSGGEKKRAEMVQMGILDPSSRCSTRPTAGSTSTRCEAVGEGINRIMRAPKRACF